MIKTVLTNTETNNDLYVNKEGAASVIVHTHPPLNEVIVASPFSQYFTTTGISAGSSDMTVNGATTNVDFYITASPDYDIYIKTISVLIGDNGAALNLFGAIAALSNGIEFTHNTLDGGTTILHSGIKDNLEFVRLGLNSPQIGAGTTAFRADTTGSGADTYLPVIRMTDIFGLPWGLRLRKGTEDNIAFTVRNNISAPDTFNIIGYGIKI